MKVISVVRFLLIILTSLISLSNVNGQFSTEKIDQDENDKEQEVMPYYRHHIFGITLGIGGQGFSFLSASVDVFIKDFNIEIGRGSGIAGTHDGSVPYGSITKHNLLSKNNGTWSYFYGLGYAKYKMIIELTSYGREEYGQTISLATGIQAISRDRFTFKIELGPVYKIAREHHGYDNSSRDVSGISAYFTIKIGVHFGKEKAG